MERVPQRYEESVPFDRLVPHPDNANRGATAIIEESVGVNGFYGAVLAQEGTGTIIAGHHRIDAARAEGGASVPVLWLTVDDERMRRILAVDNSSTRKGSDDPGALAALLADLAESVVGLVGTGFDAAELDELLASVAPEPEARTDPDDVPEPPAEPVTKLGDLWLLGPHRVLCGDATAAEDMGTLMNGAEAELATTDPPYNVDEDYATYPDTLTDESHEAFARAWFTNLQAHSERQVLTPGWVNLTAWCRWFDPTAVAPRIAKNSMVAGRVSGWSCWEPLLFFGTGWKSAPQRANDLFEYGVSNQQDTADHPCPKPVAMWVDLIGSYSGPGSAVIDPLAGVGVTLMAAHQLGRVAYLLEIDPHYVDVICHRYQAHTGTVPILESTGEPHDFMEN